jgi:PTH1 family peptidyl-tRNA hydrolase
VECAVGLGNPGRRYRLTRHNAGFLVIEKLYSLLECSWRKKARLYEARRCGFEGTEVLLLRPLTYMNLSGRAVEAVREDFGLSLQEFLVICDDASLPPGRIRFRKKGSSGGHKGLQSIIEILQTQAFPRLRIGIGAPLPGQPLEEYVLSKPNRSEKKALAETVSLATEAALYCLREGLDAAMSKFN